jgi:hypothetical protein
MEGSRPPNPPNGPFTPRATFTSKTGKVFKASDYGYRCWPIRVKEKLKETDEKKISSELKEEQLELPFEEALSDAEMLVAEEETETTEAAQEIEAPLEG